MKQKKQKNAVIHRSKRKNARAGSANAARKKKQKGSIIWVGGLILIIILVVGFGWNKMHPTQNANPQELKKQDSQEQPFVGEFKVTRVIDGDTIEIEGGEKVRYIGMDTPEAEPAECFSQEATNKNKELVEGKTVRLEKDTTDRDKYGRLLRYVYAGDIFVNLKLVSDGFATIQVHPADIKHLKQLAKAHVEAKNSALGLWSACPVEK